MAAEEGSRSSGSADSYIGSLISLISKSEIRYEGLLFNINTAESSIGLSNVRSFGTEGRKKDGPQLPPGDIVYEYILFRGSDIKDLQVKSSPPVQTTAPIYNDPAIIQSHYSQGVAISTSLPSTGTGSQQDLRSHTSQVGLPKSTFQESIPLYEPSMSGSWGSSHPPPTTNGSRLPVQMYSQKFYGNSNGLQTQQQSLVQPRPGLSMPPSMQQTMQYPVISPPLPTRPSILPATPLAGSLSPLLPRLSTGTLNLHSSMLPFQSSAVASDSSTCMPNKAPTQALPPPALSISLPFVSPLSTVLDKSSFPEPDKLKTVADSIKSYNNLSETKPSAAGTSSSFLDKGSTPSLVTPNQLMQAGPTTASSFYSSQSAQKDVEVVQASSPELSPSTSTEAQTPLLPLASPPECKVSGYHSHTHHNNRGGREIVKGTEVSHHVTGFTEDFDFSAMNEKFNKDEVWGHLGKSNRIQEDGYGSQDEDDAGTSKFENKRVYVKDDFFDTLSCNAFDRGSHNGRSKFSEQMKLDAETFGNFARHRGGRGGHGFGRGGRGYVRDGRGYGRGAYYGRSYGYIGRGWGHHGT